MQVYQACQYGYKGPMPGFDCAIICPDRGDGAVTQAGIESKGKGRNLFPLLRKRGIWGNLVIKQSDFTLAETMSRLRSLIDDIDFDHINYSGTDFSVPWSITTGVGTLFQSNYYFAQCSINLADLIINIFATPRDPDRDYALCPSGWCYTTTGGSVYGFWNGYLYGGDPDVPILFSEAPLVSGYYVATQHFLGHDYWVITWAKSQFKANYYYTVVKCLPKYHRNWGDPAAVANDYISYYVQDPAFSLVTEGPCSVDSPVTVPFPTDDLTPEISVDDPATEWVGKNIGYWNYPLVNMSYIDFTRRHGRKPSTTDATGSTADSSPEPI